MLSDYPHTDTIVVTTQDLDEFKSLCAILGVDYHIYARPSDPEDTGNCLIKLSMDDMHLLAISSNKVKESPYGGMKTFMGYTMQIEYAKRDIELRQVHAILKSINT